MHTITGFYFFTKAGGKKFVVYSTKYSSGRYASLHECTGMTDEQARGKFVIEHNKEVDYLIMKKRSGEANSRIILNS